MVVVVDDDEDDDVVVVVVVVVSKSHVVVDEVADEVVVVDSVHAIIATAENIRTNNTINFFIVYSLYIFFIVSRKRDVFYDR